MKNYHLNLKTAVVCAVIGLLAAGAGGMARAQNQPYTPNLSPDLQEVVKLSQARMPDDVIKNYIASTGKSYRLSADDIIYLNRQGVSSAVITTLETTASAAPSPAPSYNPPPQPDQQPQQSYPPQQPSPQQQPAAYPSPPPGADTSAVSEPTPPPPPEVNYQYFHDQLSPFGTWVSINGVTYWRPDQAVAVNPDWRPYYDMGQWVDTDNGLYWQSDYTWGDIPFHYGRWVLQPGMGWLWAPDYTWGPAWVFWRQDEGDACIGWAPLPVGAVWLNGGFFFRGVSVGLDFDFGLGDSCFTFVGYDHFHEGFFRMRGHEWAHHIDRQQVHSFYGHSVLRNDFRKDDHGRFVNNGIGRDRVEHLTHVEHSNFEERTPVGDRNKLANNRTEQFKQGEGHGVGDNHNATTHGQAVNTGSEHFRAEGENRGATAGAGSFGGSGAHEQNFGNAHGGNGGAGGGSVSKVYRPPAGGQGGGGGHESQTRQGGQGGQGGHNK